MRPNLTLVHSPGEGTGVDVQQVTAHARKRLGIEIQAANRVRARRTGDRTLEVWSLLTEHGRFWLVEEVGEVELFRTTQHGRAAVGEATRRFLELHPSGPARPAALSPADTRPPAPRPRETPAPYECHTCGAQVTPRRPSGQAERQLCARCYRVERARAR